MKRLLPLFLLACIDEPTPTITEGVAPGTLVMATSSDDYQVGALGLLDPTSGELESEVAILHGDAVVVTEGDDLFVVNRLLMDTVRRYDRSDPQTPLWETSVGRGANPHDVATCGGVLWVSRYEEAELYWLDRDTGERLGSLDLTPLADDDGVGEMSDLVVLGDRLYVGMQRLARDRAWQAEPNGRVAVIDCAAREQVDAITTGPNPILREHDASSFFILHDEGVDHWDGETTPLWDTPLVDLDVDAGNVVAIRRDGSDHAVWCTDALGGDWTIGLTLAAYLPDLLVDGNTAWVAARRGWQDPSEEGGLLEVDAGSCALIRRTTSTLPPFSLARW